MYNKVSGYLDKEFCQQPEQKLVVVVVVSKFSYSYMQAVYFKPDNVC